MILHLNDMEILVTKRFIPRRFELDTTSVRRFGLLRPGISEAEVYCIAIGVSVNAVK